MPDHEAIPYSAPDTLPPVLAGPLLRHVATDRLVFWLVVSEPFTIRLRLTAEGQPEPLTDRVLSGTELQVLRLGEHAFLYLIEVLPELPLPEDRRIGYDLGLSRGGSASPSWIADWAPHLCLEGRRHPDFVIKSRLDRLLHGSCRRPHHPAPDGLCRVDEELQRSSDDASGRPALLLMTGDQIYADDVAGPMLRAIHALIARLGLYQEALQGSDVANSRALAEASDTYYRREYLLPATAGAQALAERFFAGAEKPVFTTANAHNHLISLSEVLAMYLLVWSPACWPLAQSQPPALGEELAHRYQREQACIDQFVAGLPQAARALAHVPSYMIFDDHDITDDWNLSALWESTAYGHPFSRRIVGNALIGYLLCQGWGNNPPAFAEVMPRVERLLNRVGPDGFLDRDCQDRLIDDLLTFHHWHYSLPTHPRLVVLDTRTRRWHSEVSPGRPSGLMNWEALSEFQQTILGERAVVVVSPAPMFGVKLIEAIQTLFTLAGQPLMVDAENWMAHRGAANVLLNIFGHSGTPDTFVILSGDVHYSFAYDVRLRHKPNGPRIWQITSSGLKNQFPERLLEWLDRLNRWLYSPRSPLNWFTKRRRMRVAPRLPTGRDAGERLWNSSGVGLLVLDAEGIPREIRQLNAKAGETEFKIAGRSHETYR